jgi:hypothetical protein
MDQSAASILLTCLRYASEVAKAEQLARVPAEEWRMVAELAQQHGVEPLLYHNLKPLNMALPGEMVDELKQEYRQNALRNMRLYKELNKLLRLLQENEIPVIVLKGAYLAEAVYANIALRTMGDVDLLVKKDDLLRIEQKLLALGCVSVDCNRVIAQDNYHFGYKLPRSGLSVEMHWMIADSTFPFQIDTEGLWSRAQPVILAQAPTLVLSPEDLMLHLCLHMVTHAYEMSIRMFCDIDELVRRQGTELNWQEIGARARQWNVVHSVYLILRLAQELLGAAVPADWLVSLCPEDFSEHYLDLAREQILFSRSGMKISAQGADYLPFPQLSQLWGPKDLGSKLALIRSRLLPSRETMARQYPVSVNSWRIFLYYPLRIKDILVGRGAALWHLARGDPKMQAIAEHTNQVVSLRDWLISG